MRIVAWNLRHGGGASRMPAIALALVDAAPDIVALCECRDTTVGQIAAILADAGLEHILFGPGEAGENRLVTASRWKIDPVEPLHRRVVAATIPALDLTIVSAHVPHASDASGRCDAAAALIAAARRTGRPTVIVGDLNSSRDPSRTGRIRTDLLLGTLCSTGFCDAFTIEHPAALPGSWAPRSSDPATHRLDHALVSAQLTSAVRRAAYDDSARTGGLSDHAMLMLDLDREPGAGLAGERFSTRNFALFEPPPLANR